eukprot:3366303-Alexandrium_andersonii.AAC.1
MFHNGAIGVVASEHPVLALLQALSATGQISAVCSSSLACPPIDPDLMQQGGCSGAKRASSRVPSGRQKKAKTPATSVEVAVVRCSK